MSACFAVARYLAVTSGRSAIARALPLYLAIGIASVVLFAGNGLDARSVTESAERSRGFRGVLLGAWWLGTLPVGRAWLGDRAALSLRALPAPRAAVFGVLGAGCLAIELPWAVLWLRGASPAAALWAVMTALALLATSLAGVRSAFDALGPAVAIASFWVGPDWVLTAASAGSFCRGLALAWSRAPEPPARGGHWVFGASRALAYASALAAATLRGQAPVFGRALGITLASALLPALYIRRNGGPLLLWAFTFWAPACIFGTTAIAGPLSRVGTQFGWIVRAHGADVVAARALPALAASWGAAMGSAFALVMGLLLGLALGPLVSLAAQCALAGVFWALAAYAAVRHSTRGSAERAGRLMLMNTLLTLGSIALSWSLLGQ